MLKKLLITSMCIGFTSPVFSSSAEKENPGSQFILSRLSTTDYQALPETLRRFLSGKSEETPVDDSDHVNKGDPVDLDTDAGNNERDDDFDANDDMSVQALQKKLIQFNPVSPEWDDSSDEEDIFATIEDIQLEKVPEEVQRIRQEEVEALRKAAKQQKEMSNDQRTQAEELLRSGQFQKLQVLMNTLQWDWGVRCFTLWGLYQKVCDAASRSAQPLQCPPLQFLFEYLYKEETYPRAIFQLVGFKLAENNNIEIEKYYKLPELQINRDYISTLELNLLQCLQDGVVTLFDRYDELGADAFIEGIQQFSVLTWQFSLTETQSSAFPDMLELLNESLAKQTKTARWIYNESKIINFLQSFKEKNNIDGPLLDIFVKQAQQRLHTLPRRQSNSKFLPAIPGKVPWGTL